MFWSNNYDNEGRGYTRGGIDVITGVNLFFKFLLLSPVFLLAGIVFVTMFKHVIYHGVPTMGVPTEEQKEQLREQNARIGISPESSSLQPKPAPPVVEAVRQPEPVAPRRPSAPVVRATQAQIDTHWKEARFRNYCVTSWLPKYGNNPNAANDPCMQFK